MMAALIGGERDPKVLAELARARHAGARSRGWRKPSPGCGWGRSTTITGSCWPGCWPASTPSNADIAAVDTEIGDHLAPFADAVARLDEIPGIGPTAAAVIIAEIGIDMSRFPTPAHLCLVGEVRSRDQLLRRQDQGQRLDRAR